MEQSRARSIKGVEVSVVELLGRAETEGMRFKGSDKDKVTILASVCDFNNTFSS